MLVGLDLPKAHHTLIQEILHFNISITIKKWAVIYLRGSKLKHRRVKQGVPQVRVLSPTLFNITIKQPPGTDLIDMSRKLDCWFLARSLKRSPGKSFLKIVEELIQCRDFWCHSRPDVFLQTASSISNQPHKLRNRAKMKEILIWTPKLKDSNWQKTQTSHAALLPSQVARCAFH